MSDDDHRRVNDAIDAGRVPEDITADFLLQSRDRPAIVGIIVVTSLTFFVVICRMLSRTLILKRFGLDDSLALASLVRRPSELPQEMIEVFKKSLNRCELTSALSLRLCVASQVLLIAFVALCIELIRLGSGRHFAYIENVLDIPTVQKTQVLDYAAHIIYTTALLLCRVSGLAFYHRVCGVHQGFQTAIKVTLGVLIAGYLPQLLLIVFHCRPVTGLWPYGWEPGVEGYVCLQWGVVYVTNSTISLICDILLFGIPGAMLRVLEMPQRRKIQLGCILLPGSAVIAISIARLVLVVRGQWESDMSWSYNTLLAVEVSEIGATLIALSVPGIKPAFDKFIMRKSGTTRLGGSNYKRNTGSQASKATALSALKLKSEYGVIGREPTMGRHGTGTEVSAVAHSGKISQEGIQVTVDFEVYNESGVALDKM
ncbi:hypothetical protein CDD83_10403 [Cordyceps sp. RAO-2017]|nr:hypothetical protein CDD83_10403 [Cordyceps sp. RAO-2017]